MLGVGCLGMLTCIVEHPASCFEGLELMWVVLQRSTGVLFRDASRWPSEDELVRIVLKVVFTVQQLLGLSLTGSCCRAHKHGPQETFVTYLAAWHSADYCPDKTRDR